MLAARGEWTTNDKGLIARAGLREADGIVAGLEPGPESLIAALDGTEALIRRAVRPPADGSGGPAD
ncbi:hypothetical protein GCM10009549_07430 [Streptomyces thermoalcalitolerans]|uniref:Uncharacterized protein n=1 Tax=Streptomyces thermoalcalitolerans TaxID=65605 RepID=A0ABN1NED8_9ACTN